jgi:hypothetical protein
MLKVVKGRPPVLDGRFEIVGTIDVVGNVWHYLGWDNTDEVWCSVQVLGFKHARERVARARFAREIQSLDRLRHPHILKVIRAEPEHEAHPFAVLEVTEAGSVADWVKSNGPMPPYLAIDVMSQICGALSAAHGVGASHGALRMDQVLVDRLGSCKLVGFRGGGEKSDITLDIKACGGMLYTMISGRAFDGSRAEQLVGSLSPAVARAVMMTQKGRGGYADISTFSRDLEAAVLELPMPAGHVPPLAGADCALPDDPALIFSDEEVFDDLKHLSRLAEDGDYQPSAQELEREVGANAAAPTAPAPQQAAPEVPVREAPKQVAAIPYVMGRPGEVGDETHSNPDGMPDYLQGEDNTPKGDGWDKWKPEPEEKNESDVPKAEPSKVSDQMLMRLVGIGAGFLVLVMLGSFGYGFWLVSQSRSAAEDAGEVLIALVAKESGLVYAMGAVGADKPALELSYFAFSDAQNARVRQRAAANFAAVVDQQARANGLDRVSAAGSADALTQRIDVLTKANAGYSSKRALWENQATGFPGVLSVILGVQLGPP